MSGTVPHAAAVTPSNAAWTATEGDGAAMHRGTLQVISPSAGTFSVYGQKLTFDPLRVRVFNSNGKADSVLALKRGGSIRFTLDPADIERRRVAVIYID
jgi:hypothetical protein